MHNEDEESVEDKEEQGEGFLFRPGFLDYVELSESDGEEKRDWKFFQLYGFYILGGGK